MKVIELKTRLQLDFLAAFLGGETEQLSLQIARRGTEGAAIWVIMKSDNLPPSVQTYHLESDSRPSE